MIYFLLLFVSCHLYGMNENLLDHSKKKESKSIKLARISNQKKISEKSNSPEDKPLNIAIVSHNRSFNTLVVKLLKNKWKGSDKSLELYIAPDENNEKKLPEKDTNVKSDTCEEFERQLWNNIQFNRIDSIKQLLTKFPNASNYLIDCKMPLVYEAVGFGLPKVELLVMHGANIDQQNEDGWTPVMRAAETNSFEITEYLLKKGANVNLQAEDGSTALLAATRCCLSKICKLLVDSGADSTIKNKEGESALQIALTNNYNEIVQLFLQQETTDIN